MRVLVTGGAGYIGSHTLVVLLAAGHEVLVVDNFANSVPEALVRVERLSNRRFARATLDLRETEALATLCRDFRPEAVVHFAGLKAVAESVEKPLLYYDNNVRGTLSLVAAMEASGCRRIVFPPRRLSLVRHTTCRLTRRTRSPRSIPMAAPS